MLHCKTTVHNIYSYYYSSPTCGYTCYASVVTRTPV